MFYCAYVYYFAFLLVRKKSMLMYRLRAEIGKVEKDILLGAAPRRTAYRQGVRL